MKLEQSFEVQAPIDVVWAALNDLERVAPCLPGAAITGHDEDGTYHGEFKVKLGPTTAAYRGTIKIESADESTHTATLAAKGSDKRGQGGANATIVNTLAAIDGGTRVDAVTDFAITGRLARFGRGGMIQDISNRLLRDFATCLATRLGEGAPAAPTGAEVTAGDAPPEAVAAAAPEAATAPAAGAAAASAGGPTAGGPAATPVGDADATDVPAGEHPQGAGSATGNVASPPPGSPAVAGESPAAGPSDAPPGPVQGGPPPATAAAGGPPRTFTPPPPSEPLKAGSLFWAALWDRIKRIFSRGKR
ncbi:SRPBCC family protein [Candidatus Solirubrobacter pratensis]|uniref:SRPBCC family protein n=1 Tax=Candidatus Solirubrobacter pratensis TaxID=1298857 RepID=UPI000421F3C5|nr:SRPBCC family protein [Candidatus Solirubrobacter pratensis]